MNLNKYNTIRFFLILKGIVPSFLNLFSKRCSKRIIFSSEFNLFFNHCSKYLFLHFIDNYKGYECKFVINDEKRRRQLQSVYGDYFINTNTLKGIIVVLGAQTWITASFETPVGGFFLKYKRNVIHLSHGSPVKAIGANQKLLSFSKKVYYKIISTNFTHFLSASPAFDSTWKNIFGSNNVKILRSPICRNDNKFKNIDISCLLDKSQFNILYAPTWRPDKDVILFPFDDLSMVDLVEFLRDNNIKIFLRLHPNFQLNQIPSYLISPEICLLTKEMVDDINSVLFEFDLLVTDYSSIGFDFLLSSKPLIFLPYDYEEYLSRVGFSVDYGLFSPGPMPNTMSEFIKSIKNIQQGNDKYTYKREHVNSIVNPVTSDQCDTVARNVISLISTCC